MGTDADTHSQTLGGERSQVGGLHWDPPLEAQGEHHRKADEELWEPEGREPQRKRTPAEHSP